MNSIFVGYALVNMLGLDFRRKKIEKPENRSAIIWREIY